MARVRGPLNFLFALISFTPENYYIFCDETISLWKIGPYSTPMLVTTVQTISKSRYCTKSLVCVQTKVIVSVYEVLNSTTLAGCT